MAPLHRPPFIETLWPHLSLVTIKLPVVSGTHLINVDRKEGLVVIRSTQWFCTWPPGKEIQFLNHETIVILGFSV